MLLSEAHTAIRDAVRSYAQAEIRPRSHQFEKAGGYPADLFHNLAGMGLMGMMAPECFGGAASDCVSYALALMELAAADGALSTIISIQNSIIVSALLRDGSPEQQTRHLPELISGQVLGAFALTESDAGTDASAIRTRARRTNGGWMLEGSKQFITSGKIAKLALVIAVTDPQAAKRGMTAFLVPTDRPGYYVDKVEDKLGQKASDTCAIRFEKLFVEDALVLGPVGAGYSVALANLEAGRIGIAAQSVGMAQTALEIAVAYAKERKSMGQPIIKHQAVGFRLADLAAKLEAARQLVLHAAELKDAGRLCGKEASMAKLVASETAELVCSGALQTLGGYGYLEDFKIAKIYRDVRASQIYEGTSDVQRMVILRAL